MQLISQPSSASGTTFGQRGYYTPTGFQSASSQGSPSAINMQTGQQFYGSGQIPWNILTGAPLDGSGSASGSASASGGGSLPAPIAPPSLDKFQYSADALNYPTYLRNLGEVNAQRGYQQMLNSIGMGNAQQNAMHAFDNMNSNRLGYMSQAGQEELGVNKALQSEQDFHNQLLADLYKTQVGQRGQDVDYLSALARINAAQAASQTPISLGGGNSQLAVFKANGGTWKNASPYGGLEQEANSNMKWAGASGF